MTGRDWFGIQRFPHEVIRVEEADRRETVAFYLVPGSRDVAVIDTGLGGGDLPALTARLSPMRPVVLQTHLHWDHVGASRAFADVRAHAAEVDARRVGWPWEPPGEDEASSKPGAIGGLQPPGVAADATLTCSGTLRHGDRIDLGDRVLEVLHTPGHSPGSVSFLDRDARALFCGDLCYLGKMLLFVSGSDLRDFRDSLRAAAAILGDVDAIYPAHGTAPMTGDDLIAIRDAFEMVWGGAEPDWQGSYEGRRIAIHDFGRFAFLVPPD